MRLLHNTSPSNSPPFGTMWTLSGWHIQKSWPRHWTGAYLCGFRSWSNLDEFWINSGKMGNFGEGIFLREKLSALGREKYLSSPPGSSNRTVEILCIRPRQMPSQAVGTSCGTSTGLVCDKNHSSSSAMRRPLQKCQPSDEWLDFFKFFSPGMRRIIAPGEVTDYGQNMTKYRSDSHTGIHLHQKVAKVPNGNVHLVWSALDV